MVAIKHDCGLGWPRIRASDVVWIQLNYDYNYPVQQCINILQFNVVNLLSEKYICTVKFKITIPKSMQLFTIINICIHLTMMKLWNRKALNYNFATKSISKFYNEKQDKNDKYNHPSNHTVNNVFIAYNVHYSCYTHGNILLWRYIIKYAWLVKDEKTIKMSNLSLIVNITYMDRCCAWRYKLSNSSCTARHS